MAADRDGLGELEQLLAARRGRREGGELRFLCPAHEDEHPSARWNPVKRTWCCDACKAGGGWRDLAGRLGLAVDLTGDALAEVETVYDYRDADGRLRFQVVRKRGKRFACRAPLAGGGWAWSLAGVERLLYRLPETLAAIRSDTTVFVVEGEKDADRLAALGLAATTNPGGAGKWRPPYSAALGGARVVLLPDNDDAGRSHACAVAAGLAGTAAEVRLLELPSLPPKGDVSDWIAERQHAGCTTTDLRRELEALARAAPLVVPGTLAPATRPSRVRWLSEIKPEPVAFLWRPYIPLRKLTLLEGDPGQGKSWISAALAAGGSRGDGLPDLPAFPPFRTLFFTAEDGLADTLRPRLDALGADCSRVCAHDQPLNLAAEDDLTELEEALARYAPQLVVVDPLVAYLGAKLDAYRANEVRSILAPLARLAESYACAILAVRHLNKAKGTRSIYAGQGSIDFAGAARSVLLAGSSNDDSDEHALVHIKSNLARLGGAVAYTIDEQGFRWGGPSPLRASDLLAPEVTTEDSSALSEARLFIRNLLASGPVPVAEVWAAASRAGISEITLRRAKQREGVTTQHRGFGSGACWLWSYPVAAPKPEDPR
jgi:putative DNA primase/helicase